MLGLGEPTMQPRESAPLWVGLTFVLMVVGAVIYLTGYFVVEDLLAFFKWRKDAALVAVQIATIPAANEMMAEGQQTPFFDTRKKHR
jgi:hypothetical protein